MQCCAQSSIEDARAAMNHPDGQDSERVTNI